MVFDVEKFLFFKPLVGHQKKVVSVLFIHNDNNKEEDEEEDESSSSVEHKEGEVEFEALSLVSASEDYKLKIWNIKLGECVTTL